MCMCVSTLFHHHQTSAATRAKAAAKEAATATGSTATWKVLATFVS